MTRLTEIKHNAKYLFLVVLLAFSFIFCTSQERQSVGLVLSGGGAKGIAHIGVIQALEEDARVAVVGRFFTMVNGRY